MHNEFPVFLAWVDKSDDADDFHANDVTAEFLSGNFDHINGVSIRTECLRKRNSPEAASDACSI